MLDKKQIQAIFLFEFKMGHKAVEATGNISNAFGPGTANEHTVQWSFKKFCKGDESLGDEEYSGMKKLDKWVPHELTTNKITHCFEVLSSLTLHNNNEPFLYWVVILMKSVFYMTTSDDQGQWLD